jgi:signal transduction histidine kinase
MLPLFLRTAILAGGYAFLVAFGAQTYLPPEDEPSPQAEKLLFILQAGWLVPYLLALILTLSNLETTATIAEILARYLLAFPGSLLAAFGLRRQSYQTLTPERRAPIRISLRLVEAVTGAFGAFNLILVPPAGFPPAAWINTATFPIPPALIWALLGSLWVIGLIKTLTYIQWQIETWIESVEQLQTLAADRERISRDLHDGTIQSIYAAGLMLEGIQLLIPEDPARAQAQLGRVMDTLNQTIQEIRRYIFDLRSDLPDEPLEPGIRRLLRDFHINTLLETEMQVQGEQPSRPISVERRRHIFQIVRETLTNTARHARARRVKVDLTYGPEALELTIHDDGVGMETLLVSKGYGLRNIRERTRLLDGTLRIESAPSAGFTLHLVVPY